MRTDHRTCSGVLVVDDDYEIRHAIMQILAEEGYETQGAFNGEEALAQLERSCSAGERLPCVIILDCMMPVMDGRELQAAMHDNPKLSTIPLVVISGDRKSARSVAAEETQAPVAALVKPLQLDALLKTVARFC
jgi:CheY-like chemotaxis protein